MPSRESTVRAEAAAERGGCGPGTAAPGGGSPEAGRRKRRGAGSGERSRVEEPPRRGGDGGERAAGGGPCPGGADTDPGAGESPPGACPGAHAEPGVCAAGGGGHGACGAAPGYRRQRKGWGALQLLGGFPGGRWSRCQEAPALCLPAVPGLGGRGAGAQPGLRRCSVCGGAAEGTGLWRGCHTVTPGLPGAAAANKEACGEQRYPATQTPEKRPQPPGGKWGEERIR